MKVSTVIALTLGMSLLGSVANAQNAKMMDPLTRPRAVAAAGNDFGFRLLGELGGVPGNVFYSPASISMALGMVYNGAAGTTKDGMAKTLGIDKLTLDNFNAGNKGIMQMMEKSDPKVTTDIANGIWVQNDFPLLPDFITRNKTAFQAEVTNMDLTTPAAAGPINSWIAKNTNDKIKDLLKPTDFTQDTRLILANAVYFKGEWSVPFEKDLTQDADFTLLGGKTKKVPMMSRHDDFSYAENNQFQAIRLPYGGRRIMMTVILPKANVKADAFAKSLTVENWNAWQQLFSKNKGTLRLPKMKLDYEVGLNDKLSKMGMQDAFTAGTADLSGMTGKKDLFITLVRHKATLDVNETDTEAT
ncbi:MAG: serpin family protein, partial [bacterium]